MRVLVLCSLLLLLVAGCQAAQRQPARLSASPSPTASALSPSPPVGQAPAFRSAAAPGVVHEGGQLGAIWELTDFRHEAYADRVRLIWQMAGGAEGPPFYRLAIVDNKASPHPTASNEPWGTVRVDLIFFDVYARSFPLREQFPLTDLSEALPVVRVDQYPTFDDASLGFSVGLRQRLPIEVYEFTTPARLVIDILVEP